MPFTRQRHNGTKHLNDATVNDALVNDTLSNAVQNDETVELASRVHDSRVNDVSAASSFSRFAGAHATLSSRYAARHMSTHAHDHNAHCLLHPIDAVSAASMSSRNSLMASRLALPVFAACAGAFSILQAFAKPSGVWGWTSGSQTYLRARPGAKTPAVAKVPRHTKMFVWGKFDGWYRVETPDHKFGWVFNTYIRSTDESKIPELSHRKARIASNRTESQTMYGSPALLRQHLARYGAKGAAQGLEKQGIRVAGRSTSRRATNRAISRTRLARNTNTRSTTRNSATRSVATRNSTSRNTAWREIALASSRDRFARTAAPDFNDVGNVRLMPAQSPHSRRDDDRFPETTTRPDVASSRTSNEARNAISKATTRIQQKPSHRKTQAKPQANQNQAAQAQQRATQQKLVQQKLVQQKLVQQRVAARQRIAQMQAAQKRLEQQAKQARVAQARVAQAREVEAARLAQVKKAEQQRLSQEKAARNQLAQQRVAQQRVAQQRVAEQRLAEQRLAEQRLAEQRLAQERAVQQKLTQERLAQRRLAEQQAAQKRLAERMRKAESKRKLVQARRAARAARYAREAQVRAQRRALRQQRLAQQKTLNRDRLRARLGAAAVAPSMATPDLRPLTPGELLRARNDYLAAKKKNQPSVASGAGIASPDGAFNSAAAQAPAVSPSSYRAPGNGQAFSTVTRVSYSRRARPRRSGLNARYSRGGSPRDYMYRRTTTPSGDSGTATSGTATSGTATSGSPFGQTMARQAMSYRGMPYISGASSPNRGFDCSGLIYYLLRQRGYNPPRTAAGMAAYGKSVGRGELQSGDLVLFSNTYKRGISHIGIYVGQGKFVHAANHRKGVSVDSLSSKYYASKYYGARRVK